MTLFFVFSFLTICISYAQSESALLHSVKNGWSVKPLLNAGQHVGPSSYRMVGIPDGMGAFKNNNQTLTVLVNHELADDVGIRRLHGTNGAFVSKWILDIEDLTFVSGEDLIKQTMLWSEKEQQFFSSPNKFNRLCSADLAPVSAFFNASSGKGYKERLFLNGEENKAGGRAFAHVVSGDNAGTSYELPHLGKFSWENAVANPATGDLTVVAGMDDSKDGQVYFYVGEKRSEGNPVEKAGLVGGQLYAIKYDGQRFSLVGFGNVSAMSADDLEKAGENAAVSKFMRPEDGAWDTKNANVFYFATTANIDGESQIFQLKFNDIHHPEKGGDIKIVLNARAIGAQMFDNLTVMTNGNLLITEDPGNNAHLSAIWHFDPVTGNAEKVLEAKPDYFQDKSSLSYLTQDEENSGIIEITEMVKTASWAEKNKRYFLGAMQVHAKSADAELVEGGQLYLITGNDQ